MNKLKEEEIDLVYLWVDGNDPEWKKKKNLFSGIPLDDADVACEGRFSDHQELKYSLRAIEKNAPWIRKIFIVTDNQVPAWLDTSNPRIRVVDHKEILPGNALPTFNSRIIEHFLFKIPDLAEHFLYANDDMFINRKVNPSDFFSEKDGYPIIRLNRRPFRKISFWLKQKVLKKPISNYNHAIQNTSRLVEKAYGKYLGHKTHHNIDAYNRSDFEYTFNKFKKEIEPTLEHHFRSEKDIQRNIYSYVPILEKRAHKKFVTKKTSFRFHIEKLHYYKKLDKLNPMFFCMNDSQYVTDESRRIMEEYLNKRFPEPSGFEK